MKVVITSILAVVLVFISCNNDDNTPIEKKSRDQITFTGTWERQFEPVPGNTHTADYFIYQDSIRYTLTGNVGNANYVMKRDTFLMKNNRFIGHTNENKYYLIFVKNITDNSLMLYKQEVESINEGLSIDVPADDTTENHSWNTYQKQ